jgi:putative nucleotidyltransferase with HDIG domain
VNKRILFVDDEPLVLQGLQRSLRSMRSQWEMEFAEGGAQALDIMARLPFDVVITDMRMPGMDGAQLLESVKTKFPQTVRMILSGQSDLATILRSVGPTHQYLAKPCEIEDLKQKLARAFALRDLMADSHLKEVVGRLDSIPSLPESYVAITNALQSPESSIAQVGNIVSQDAGMCVKVLQLVNSAFLGLSHRVSDPKQAAALIGIDNIRALVLSVHVFSQFESSNQDLLFLWKHSLATAGLAKAIARLQDTSRNIVDDSFTGGLLHDVGKLILSSVYAKECARIWKTSPADKTSSLSRERSVLGCTHAEVGAYLLGLWGLPDSIVEAVAWHHQPSDAGPAGFSSLIAVHAANYYDHRKHSYPASGNKPALDETLLTKLGLAARPAAWELACQQFDVQETNNE